MNGLERRIEAELTPDVRSVASLFISRWDRAVAETTPANLHNRLGLHWQACLRSLSRPYRQRSLAAAGQSRGTRPASVVRKHGTKDPKASDVLYVDALAAPNTVNTMPQATLKAAADHGAPADVLPRDGGDAATTLALFDKAGVDIDELAERLQSEGADAFVQSWRDLLEAIAAKSKVLS